MRVVDSCKCTPCSSHALVHEIARNDDPEGIHQDEVSPEVGGLGARVRHVQNVVVEEARRVVEDIAIELAERDDELERVAERVVDADEIGGDE